MFFPSLLHIEHGACLNCEPLLDDQQTKSLAAAWNRRIDVHADAAIIAESVVSIWEDIDAALSPVLGQRGVALLYKRSLHLTVPAHPGLADTHEGAQTAMDLDALKSGITQLGRADAASGALDLLNTFHGLLVSLIGPSLTERLLRTVWAIAPANPQAQDTQA